jgi:hypothetical protein
LLVEMKRLGVELCCKRHDPVLLDPDPCGATESLSGLEIFQIIATHLLHLLDDWPECGVFAWKP